MADRTENRAGRRTGRPGGGGALLPAILFVAVFFLLSQTVMAWLGPACAAGTDGQTGVPALSSKNVVMYCENTGEYVVQKNDRDRVGMAGCARLAAGLTAVQRVSMDRETVVVPEAVAQPGAAMGLKAGEKVTVGQLLYGAFLTGGNDAVYMLGIAVSGSEKKFVAEMNRVVKSIGCTGTRFVNSTGIRKDGQYTSAHDLLALTRVALSNQTLRKVLGTEEYTLPQTNKNKARTLRADQTQISHEAAGIYAMVTAEDGKKNGATVVGYQKNGLDLYIVLLGAGKEAREKDLDRLIDYGVRSIRGFRAVKRGAKAGMVRVVHGEKTRVETYTQEDGYAYIPQEGSKKLITTKTVMNDSVKAPLKAGDEVGRIEIYVGGDKVNAVPLVVREAVAAGWFPSYFGISNTMTMILGAAAGILVLLVLIILIRRRRARKRRELARQRKIERLAMERLLEEEDHRRRGWRF